MLVVILFFIQSEGLRAQDLGAVNQTTVYLDFDNGVGNGFEPLPGLGVINYVVSYLTNTRRSPVGFTDLQEESIRQRVEDTFRASNVNMEVTTTKPSDGDYYTVEFGEAFGSGRVSGVAYDISPAFSWVLDRFDRRKDGTVAVFTDSPNDPSDLFKIADVASHEIAHGLGGAHIDPNVGDVVLDYRDTSTFPLIGLAELFDQPADIVIAFDDQNNGISGPNLGLPGLTLGDHNPEYHLRRYANGEDAASLEQELLLPGSWDEQGFSTATLELNLSVALSNLDNLYLSTSPVFGLDIVGQPMPNFDSPNILYDISDLLGGQTIDIGLADFSNVTLLGRTAGSEFIDVALGSIDGDVGVPLNLANSQSGDFAFFRVNSDGAPLSVFSDVHGSLSDQRFVTPSMVSAVPIPSNWVLTLSGFLAFAGFLRQRRLPTAKTI